MKRLSLLFSFFFCCILISATTAQSGCSDIPGAITNAAVPSGYCAYVWASGVSSPRHMAVASNGDVLVVLNGRGSIAAYWDANNDGSSGSGENAVIATVSGNTLSHALVLDGGYLYATSTSTVYRWPYSGQRTSLGNAQVIVRNIGGKDRFPNWSHSTREIAVLGGQIYVQQGSFSNVDTNATFTSIRRFSLSSIPSGGYDWQTSGELFAYGLRNEAGLGVHNNVLWGVENGRDNLNRNDLGGDIHWDNPIEEVNRFTAPAGSFYGYPYCWSEGYLPAPYGKGNLTQWADPTFINDGVHTDAWCRNTNNVKPPIYGLQAHTAPLSIIFSSNYPSVSLSSFGNSAFVAQHGSWNRPEAVGYRVTQLVLSSDGTSVLSSKPVFSLNAAIQTGSSWPYRPVGLAMKKNCRGTNNCLLISSDANGQIIALVDRNTQSGSTSASVGTTSTSSTTGSTQPPNNNNCGCASSEACCNGACYSPSFYTCASDPAGGQRLCPAGTQACSGACYDPQVYSCVNGQLRQGASQGSTTGGSCTGSQCGTTSSTSGGTTSTPGGSGDTPDAQCSCGGGESCCNGACYSPSFYSCATDPAGGKQLCPAGARACNKACYDPQAYSCTNNALQRA